VRRAACRAALRRRLWRPSPAERRRAGRSGPATTFGGRRREPRAGRLSCQWCAQRRL
jgi:hypothetical protein